MYADDDIGLVSAEAELEALQTRAEAADNGAEAGELLARVFDLDRLILTTPPATLEGCAVKLRRLVDPQTGLAAGDGKHDLDCVRQALAVIERLIASSR